MRTLLALLTVSLLPLTAFATADEVRIMPVESEMNARKATCLLAESTVRRRGAVIVHYGDGLFERVVAHSGFCQREESAVPFYAATIDSEACFLGYRCVQSGPGGDVLE